MLGGMIFGKQALGPPTEPVLQHCLQRGTAVLPT